MSRGDNNFTHPTSGRAMWSLCSAGCPPPLRKWLWQIDLQVHSQVRIRWSLSAWCSVHFCWIFGRFVFDRRYCAVDNRLEPKIQPHWCAMCRKVANRLVMAAQIRIRRSLSAWCSVVFCSIIVPFVFDGRCCAIDIRLETAMHPRWFTIVDRSQIGLRMEWCRGCCGFAFRSFLRLVFAIVPWVAAQDHSCTSEGWSVFARMTEGAQD